MCKATFAAEELLFNKKKKKVRINKLKLSSKHI